jgi:hypothetical protein
VNVDHHTLAVDIGNLKRAQLGPPQPRRVESHKDGPVHQVARCVNQPGDFVLTENGWQWAWPLRKRDMIRQVWPSQCLHEEEPQRGCPLLDGAGGQFAVAKQMDLVRADVLRPKLIGALPEERRELLDGADVTSYSIRGIVSTLEFVQHHFSKMGHRDLLVTHTLQLQKTATGVRDA